MMLNSKSIGNKIASARKKSNLSQAELAMRVAISPQAVGKWERGESMPDIGTLNRLAEILGLDLNYFSESFKSSESEESAFEPLVQPSPELPVAKQPDQQAEKKLNWDMSKLNLADSDFSGLKNLHEKFSSSNIQRCLFVGSDMRGLHLNTNNIDGCDFSHSDMSKCHIQNSNLGNNRFNNCSLLETEFSKCNILACDFTDTDFTKTTFTFSNFMKNTLVNARWKNSTFRDMQIQDIVFEGTFEACFFENCSFYGVKFQNAILCNTFFKNNRKFKRVQFVDCKVDKITYAFLKSNHANLTGITLLNE